MAPPIDLVFSEYAADKVGRITPGGAIIEYPVPTPYSNPAGLVARPDQRVWFTEFIGKIGALRPSTGEG